MKQIRFTKKGFEAIKKEHTDLLEERPAAVLDLKKAREMGDLSENGYYKAAKWKLSEIDRNLRRLLINIKSAVISDNSGKKIVGIGSSVRLSDGKNEFVYEIVGDLEADPKLKKISLLSPIGQALENKKTRDTVEIETPSGKIKYKILKIS